MAETIKQVQPSVDLTTCESEPIHIPGRVQSHGCLFAVDSSNCRITYVSENCEQFTGITAANTLQLELPDFFRIASINTGYIDVIQLCKQTAEMDFETINPIPVRIKEEKYNLIAHPSGNYMLLEFEEQSANSDMELERRVGISLSRILEAKTLDQMLQYVARQIKEIIAYDRVMVYKFWEDDHGEVVAEDRNDDLEPFLGLHYPASDIPKQARELYKINLVRIIADVDSSPSDLVVADPALANAHLDLTHANLRAVSPIHIQYLKNMGVGASFSISIVVKDRLWGLIACHNYSPKFIDYKSRSSARLIGKILSSSLEYREEQERKEQSQVFNSILQNIIKRAMKDWNIANSLVHPDGNILDLTNAEGAVLVFGEQYYKLGETPDDEAILDIMKWIRLSNQPSLFHTDSLQKVLPIASGYKHIASGLLACTLSREMNEYIFWFKPELKKTVTWAGNPEKELETTADGISKLSPRRSFALWAEEVEGHSAPWTSAEIGSVMKLREELVHLINQKASQIRRLNEELQKAYDELDTFSFTISHDLKTPLTAIKNYTEILLEDYTDLSPDVKDILSKVVRNADRMNLLIKEVLSYSRIDRREMNFSELDMESLLKTVAHEVITAFQANHTRIVFGDTPSLKGDETMIYQVFTNIIGNAVKYSLKTEHPTVEITGSETIDEVTYKVKDNGIGIDMTYGNQVFVLFKRLENARKYEGTGVGLAIVKRIMEKHKAKIWYESAAEGGTVFYLSFKK